MAYKQYDDKIFIDAVNRRGPNTPYGFAKGLKLHHGLLRRRLEDLASQGAIVRLSSHPITYGPKADQELPPPEPNQKEKETFFAQAMELPQMEMEILNLLKREGLGSSVIGLETSKIYKSLGYGKETVIRALNHLKKHGYVTSEKHGKNTIWFIESKPKEMKTAANNLDSIMIGGSFDYFLNEVRKLFIEMKNRNEILTAQNEAFKNVSKNTHFENRTLVDEETIRGDERNRVFVALGKIMGLGPGVIADWYKAGK